MPIRSGRNPPGHFYIIPAKNIPKDADMLKMLT